MENAMKKNFNHFTPKSQNLTPPASAPKLAYRHHPASLWTAHLFPCGNTPAFWRQNYPVKDIMAVLQHISGRRLRIVAYENRIDRGRIGANPARWLGSRRKYHLEL